MKFKKFILKTNTDNRRTLIAMELKDCIDFEVKRIYYFYDIKKEAGGHCHKIEKELFICERGEAVLEIDDGSGLKDISLKQNEAVYIDSYVWHKFKNVSSDMMVLALSSTNYNPSREDYIENYQDFLKIRQGH